jgi:hypothetical protein
MALHDRNSIPEKQLGNVTFLNTFTICRHLGEFSRGKEVYQSVKLTIYLHLAYSTTYSDVYSPFCPIFVFNIEKAMVWYP